MPKGTLFPWTVSDFSLMDAIECGIVKLPRVPVADNIPGGDMPKFRELWKHVGPKMPKKGRGKSGDSRPARACPSSCRPRSTRSTAITRRPSSCGRRRGSTCRRSSSWSATTPSTSKLVYDYISGFQRKDEDGAETLRGRSAASCSATTTSTAIGSPRPSTLLIDSEQLESGEALDKDFRDHGCRRDRAVPPRDRSSARGDPRAGDKITDQDLLREVMNTVGKQGRLGESIRCVVSVSMLTEGWDANTVTHILGVRAFGTQLLCEQVVGRALRRQSYELNEDGLFNAEYADILGIPFDFTAKPVVAPPAKPRKTVRVQAVGRIATRSKSPSRVSRATGSNCRRSG